MVPNLPCARSRSLATWLCLVAFAVGCGADPSSNAAGAGQGSELPGAATTEVEWKSCDVHGPGGYEVSCGTASVPLRWQNPTGPAIDVAVVRVSPKKRSVAGQLWMLQGGPGFAGKGLLSMVDWYADHLPGYEFYLPDHRGVGESTRLGCAQAESNSSPNGAVVTKEEWPDCLAAVVGEWGTDLQAFSATQAAVDLGKLIEATRRPDVPLRVYGVSYGTFWALRYLQLYPQQAGAVVLDSVCPPGICSMTTYWTDFEATGKELLARCSQNATCHAKLGADPWGRLQSVASKLDSGHCSAVLPGQPLRPLLRDLLASAVANDDARLLIPPIIFRLDRCDSQDVAALQPLFKTMAKSQVVDPGESKAMREQYSSVLHHNVVFADLWHGTPPPLAPLLFAPADGNADLAIQPSWPAAGSDPLRNTMPQPMTPVLLLSGDLDPQTPLAFAQAAHQALAGFGAQLVVVPDNPHGVATNADHERTQCGGAITFQFLQNPEKKLDVSCLANLPPLDFAGGGPYAEMLFPSGAWGGEAKGLPLRTQTPAQAAQELWRELRRPLRL
ncbi:MAG: alpha/beta fold hydrolase [Deltaproteobacteria bacterium]|nr:alpha/beta fold hydrolase [Deltaproteobacteria bacterium]